jgi:hypothetical protein
MFLMVVVVVVVVVLGGRVGKTVLPFSSGELYTPTYESSSNTTHAFRSKMSAPQKSKGSKRTRTAATPSFTASQMVQARAAVQGTILSMEEWSSSPVWVEPETKYYKIGDTGNLYLVPCEWRGEAGVHLRHYLPVLNSKLEPCAGLIPTKDGVLFRLDEIVNLRDYAPQITRWVQTVEAGQLPVGDAKILRHSLSGVVDRGAPTTKCTPTQPATELKGKHEMYVELMPPASNPPTTTLYGHYVRITRYGKDRNVINLTTGQWNDLSGYSEFICPIVASFKRPSEPSTQLEATSLPAVVGCDVSQWSLTEVDKHLNACLITVVTRLLQKHANLPASERAERLNSLTAGDVFQEAALGRKDRQNFAFLAGIRRVATILSDIQATDKTGQRTQGQMLLEWYDKRLVVLVPAEPTSPVGSMPALVISEDDADDGEEGGMLVL